jgi:tRNA threonylcarbamoyladenosine biosynthesis protein TsaE
VTTLHTTTDSAASAGRFGEVLAAVLAPGDLVELRGDLGAGKTTTMVGIARGLGSVTPVKSPTFTFVHHHRLPDDDVELLHVDLYRIDDSRELDGLGLLDLIDDDTIVVVEWMERAGGLLPAPTVVVAFVADHDDERSVTVTLDHERAVTLRQQLGASGFTVREVDQ